MRDRRHAPAPPRNRHGGTPSRSTPIALVLIAALVVITINYSTYSKPAAAASAAKKHTPNPRAGNAKAAARKPAATSAAPKASTAAARLFLSAEPTTPILTKLDQLTGSRYSALPADPLAAPAITSVPLPVTSQSYAIWGSLGTDVQGRIWSGISSDGRGGSSAQLISYDPTTDIAVSRGMVLDALKAYDLYQPGMGQAKIHSRIIQGADGYLYFTSQDEQGETEDGKVNPRWGSWMWRMRGPDFQWEPLFHAPQGLIAVAGFGTDIYALGYHNHVLYHFDTLTAKHNSVVVGSYQGHISRNFLVDQFGQAYVPRVRPSTLKDEPPVVEIVQFDRNLREIAATKIEHYLTRRPADSHGIISFVTMHDGSIIFATHQGFLYRIAAPVAAGRATRITPIGFFHPQGSRYMSTMHTYQGRRYLVGVTKAIKPAKGQPAFEWVAYDLYLNQSHATPLDIKPPAGQSVMNLLLYGSMTRDMQGNFYIVGTHLNARLPLMYKLTPKMN